MTWKEILKIDMDEARRLGRKYAKEDMEMDDRRKAKERKDYLTERHTTKYEAAKEKIESKKDKIIEKEPDVYKPMQIMLELMEENIGTDDFIQYYTALKTISRGHDVFFRGSPR